MLVFPRVKIGKAAVNHEPDFQVQVGTHLVEPHAAVAEPPDDIGGVELLTHSAFY